ncbi:shikimate O-hydroxycinnamoyltransferase-like [Pistacia vera]|uniref:shikimate O-hydroxycinnamoyltransferase-like n=1 Tax=Pistacia vera TaxID=55513 RepID=UPI001263E4F8|nr:shikimate O-hydroxycinnamoyltransferase-like [Pistacia vera]
MEIHVKETNLVRPAQETPNHSLWVSTLDLLMAERPQVPLVHFFRRPPLPASDKSSFFDTSLLKEVLSKALVAFYPLAGRLGKDENGRLQIECNGEGALFVEAETSCVIYDEFGEDDFSPSLRMRQLVPTFDYPSTQISSNPLLLLQVTYFKCGGVCLGIGWHHILGDGTSAFHFINSWAELTRGLSLSITPLIDRTILQSRALPYPIFDHIEYHPPPSMNFEELQSSPLPTSMARLKLSLDKINTLKAKFKKDHGVMYSTYEIIVAYIWRCACLARRLPDDQVTKLYMPINGRPRLNPPLPYGYFRNVIVTATPIALVGDIQSKPLIYTAKIIHEALKRRDDEYFRSALAYLGEHDPDLTTVKQGVRTCKCPNLRIVSWAKMPMYDSDFGWGSPIYMGRASIPSIGESYVLSSLSDERSGLYA